MSRKTTTFAFFLAAALCNLIVADGFVIAGEHEHNRCRHRFGEFSDWSEPVNLGPSINTEFNEMHSAISADELSLFLATDRPGGFGGLDLWVAQRRSRHADWRPAQNLGPMINTPLFDLSPYLSPDGHWLFFSSSGHGGFGGADLFASFREDTGDNLGWQQPINLGEGVNSELDDGDPNVYVEPETGVVTMYFSRHHTGLGDNHIYTSTLGDDGTFGPAVLVPELNGPQFDAHTSIRCDGLEIFLASIRPGTLGLVDLWVSTRLTTHDPWSTPVNLGPTVNTPDNERAPYLSADGQTLYFTSDRPGGFGGNDFYMTTRHRLHHHGEDDDAQE